MASNCTLLKEAARDGRLDILENLLKQNRSILADFRLASLAESLLHVATISGRLNFVHELNRDGFRPLEIAVIMWNFEIVKEILSFNRDLCRLKGRDGRTALHYAAIKGRVDVIDLLLRLFPLAVVEDITVHGETALHLAVKSYQVDALFALVKRLESPTKELVLNMGDGNGNTVLHIAVSTKQHACIDLLVSESITTGGKIKVDAKNACGSTPLDVLDIQDSYDMKIVQKLESAGAIVTLEKSLGWSKKFKTSLEPENINLQSSQPSKNWFKYFKFQMQRDSPSATRNALLVVAALIATVCFQAGTNPPNGILEKPPSPPLLPPPNQNSGGLRPAIGPAEGSAVAAAATILGSHATSFLFLFGNSLGLAASTCILIYLTAGFPFQRELHIALYSMMFTYGFAISSIIKDDVDSGKKALVYALVSIALTLPFAQRWLPLLGKKACKYWRKRHVRETPGSNIEI